jgi:hypothetical protein
MNEFKTAIFQNFKALSSYFSFDNEQNELLSCQKQKFDNIKENEVQQKKNYYKANTEIIKQKSKAYREAHAEKWAKTVKI